MPNMPFRLMTPPIEQKPGMSSNASPTFSSLGRSPSIGPPAYTTDDLLAARNQRYSRWVYLVRTGIAAITLATSIAVIACVGVSLRDYSDSHPKGQWLLPLWPTHVDLRPSHTVLGCGITIAVLSIVCLAAAFAPMVCQMRAILTPNVTYLRRSREQTSRTSSTSSTPLPPSSAWLPPSSPSSSHPWSVTI